MNEKEILEQQLELLKTKLSIYEKKLNPEEQRDLIFDVFRTFCENRPFMSVEDFKELFWIVMDEKINEEQARECLLQIKHFNLQQTPPNLTFPEFYTWFDGKVNLNKTLDSLKTKLQASSYMQSLLTMMRRTGENFGPMTTLLNPIHSEKVTTELSIYVGSPKNIKTSLEVVHSYDGKMAQNLRSKFRGKVKNSAILKLVCGVRQNVDDFSLGELVGSLKSIFSVLQKEFGFKTFAVEPIRITHRRLLEIYIVYENQTHLDPLLKLMNGLHIEKFHGQAIFDQNPGMCRDPSAGSLQFAGQFHSCMDRSGLINLEKHFQVLQILSTLSQANMKLEFSTLDDFVAYLDPRHVKFAGWASFQTFLIPFLKNNLIDNSSIPTPVKQTYFKALLLLEDIDSILFQLEDHIFQLFCKNFDLFNLFPNHQELSSWAEPLVPFQSELRIVLLGPSHSGKSTLLSTSKNQNSLNSSFSVFRVETLLFEDHLFALWDVSSEDPLVWPHFLDGVSRILFFFDCTNPQRSLELLNHLLQLEKSKPLFLLFTKSDLAAPPTLDPALFSSRKRFSQLSLDPRIYDQVSQLFKSLLFSKKKSLSWSQFSQQKD